MAITVLGSQSVGGNKTAGAGQSFATGWVPLTADEFLIASVAWQGSVASQTLSINSITAGFNATILAQRESTGLSGIAIILVQMNKGAWAALPTTGPTISIQVNTGQIAAWGASVMQIKGAGPETAIAWVAVDNTTLTTTTPSATSGTLAIGDLVIGVISLKGSTADTFTQDNDTVGGSWTTFTASGTSGGAATSNQAMRGAYKVVTAAGTQTYNPVLGTARNYAELIGALRVYTAISPTADGDSSSDTGTLKANFTLVEAPSGVANSGNGGPYTSTTTGPFNNWTNLANILAQDSAYASVAGLNTENPNPIHVNVRASDVAGSAIPTNATVTRVVPHVVMGPSVMTWDTVTPKIGASSGMDLSFTHAPVANTDFALDPGTGNELLGLSAADWASWVAGTNDFIIDLLPFNGGVGSWQFDVDYVYLVVYFTVPVPNGSDSGSKTTSGGSTPISGTDTGGSSEASVEIAAYSQADVNGTSVETAIPLGVHGVTDVNGATAEATDVAPLATADVNGVTTEATTEKAAYTQTDVNGSSETAIPVGVHAASDVNGVTTEATIEKAVENATDTNGATTENAIPVIPVSGADTNGVTTEITTLGVLAAADTDTESETSVLKAVSTAQGDSGTDTENGIETAAYTVSDADGAPTEVSTVKAVLTFTDFNGSVENAILGAVLTASDANVSTGEVGTLALNYILTDTNIESEAFVLKVVETASENGSGTDTAQVSGGTNSFTGSDTGSGGEISVIHATSTSSDSNTTGEVSTLAYSSTVTDAGSGAESDRQGRVGVEAGSGADSASETVLYVLTQTGTSVDAVVEAVQLSPSDFGLSADASLISYQVITVTDFGSDLEASNLGFVVSDFGFGFDIFTTIKMVYADDAGSGSDSSLITKWPYFPDEPPEIITATELEQAVLVAVGEPTPEVVATRSEQPQVEISIPQKPSITRVGTDKPEIERIS